MEKNNDPQVVVVAREQFEALLSWCESSDVHNRVLKHAIKFNPCLKKEGDKTPHICGGVAKANRRAVQRIAQSKLPLIDPRNGDIYIFDGFDNRGVKRGSFYAKQVCGNYISKVQFSFTVDQLVTLCASVQILSIRWRGVGSLKKREWRAFTETYDSPFVAAEQKEFVLFLKRSIYLISLEKPEEVVLLRDQIKQLFPKDEMWFLHDVTELKYCVLHDNTVQIRHYEPETNSHLTILNLTIGRA